MDKGSSEKRYNSFQTLKVEKKNLMSNFSSIFFKDFPREELNSIHLD